MGNCLPRMAHGVHSRRLAEVPKHRRPRCSATVQQDKNCKRPPGDHEASGKEFSCMIEGGGKGGVRVKIVLTKGAAARLLASSGGSTEKMLEQVAGELRKMDSGRVGLGPCHDRWRPALESIPENARP